jgi:ABC-type multidrug transport system ATPase subunit
VQSAIEVRAVGQRARSGEVTLRDVSLTIGRGELVAIIGSSGSGKTTLLDILSGLRPPSAGTVIRASGNVGYVPQNDIIHLALPLARTLRYAAALREVPLTAVDDVLRTLELTGRSLVPVGDLSGGERKRASIAAELLGAPALFFLDEPTSGLDPARGAELMRTLRTLADNGTTVGADYAQPARRGSLRPDRGAGGRRLPGVQRHSRRRARLLRHGLPGGDLRAP